MPMKRYKPEQIVNLLRQIEVEIANGSKTARPFRHTPAKFGGVGHISGATGGNGHGMEGHR